MLSGSLRNKITPFHGLLAALLAVMAVAVTFRAWVHMFELAWEDPEYQHIFLVPLVALFLVYVRRERLTYSRISGVILGPLLVLVGWFVGSLGYDHKMQVLIDFAAVLVLIGAVVSVLGKQVLFRFFSVAFVLLMLVPMPPSVRQEIADPLQRWTAVVSAHLLGALGVQTEVIGAALKINNQPVMIAEACNGMRMVFPLLLITYGFAFGLPLRNSIRFTIVLASPIVALLCNVIRVLPLIYLQGGDKADQAWGHWLHDHSGWFMVPIAFLVLLGLVRVLKWAMVPVYRYPLASQSA
jgi:exosortase